MICYRKYRLKQPTYVIAIDLAHFFDTILLENVLLGMMQSGINYKLLIAAMNMNTAIKAKVVTAEAVSEGPWTSCPLRSEARHG